MTTSDAIDPQVWSEISKDPLAEGVVVRRVLPRLKHNVFVGETRPARQRILEMEIFGRASNLPAKWRSSKGLAIRVDASRPQVTKVRLTSTSPIGDPLFVELASDVVGILARYPGAEGATQVIERVIAWQEFFARQSEQLSKEAAAGLFSELCILDSELVPQLGASAAVYCWTGPDPAIQDFQYADCAVEVKSYRGTGAGVMKISSERQLDDVAVNSLFLAYVELDERQDGTGRSLAELITQIRAELSGTPSAYHLFGGKVLSAGWHDSYSELRSERYAVRSIEYFRVNETFPRIVASELPTGVGDVSYSLERSALDPFQVDADEVFARLKEAR